MHWCTQDCKEKSKMKEKTSADDDYSFTHNSIKKSIFAQGYLYGTNRTSLEFSNRAHYGNGRKRRWFGQLFTFSYTSHTKWRWRIYYSVSGFIYPAWHSAGSN